jgi:hypothetical protein
LAVEVGYKEASGSVSANLWKPSLGDNACIIFMLYFCTHLASWMYVVIFDNEAEITCDRAIRKKEIFFSDHLDCLAGL